MPDKLRLLVIIPDKLSDLINKGEITARYYNPGDLFDEVHILMTNDDKPDLGPLQKTVGRAKLFVHNLPAGLQVFLTSLAWRPILLKRWAKKGIELARRIKPSMIRCHGNYLNGYLAAQIKRTLRTPYVLSLHTNPHENRKYWSYGWKEKAIAYSSVSIEKVAVNYADVVIPVYKSICSYVRCFKIQRVEAIYNIVNPQFLRKKEDYSLHNPVKIISVGRLILGKCPDNLIRAIRNLNVELTSIGNGPYMDYLHRVSEKTGVLKKVRFVPFLPNDELCLMLPDYDIFAIHSDYQGIPKTILEASLVGLPIVLNKRKDTQVPELQGDWLLLVENTSKGYQEALNKLIENDHLRKSLGRRAYVYARQHWAPEKMEKKVEEIYREVLKNAATY